jgi:hypothetical protein
MVAVAEVLGIQVAEMVVQEAVQQEQVMVLEALTKEVFQQ